MFQGGGRPFSTAAVQSAVLEGETTETLRHLTLRRIHRPDFEAILDRQEGEFMEIRYLGFDQSLNFRVYRFDVRTDGRVSKQISVTADIAVFRNHSVGIQEGPLLSGNKLTTDLERGWEGEHELTAADVHAYAAAKAFADAQRAGARKASSRRPGLHTETQRKSPWRNFGI